jgi:hypothetical protein
VTVVGVSEQLENVFESVDAVQQLAPLIRMDAPIGTSTPCPVPGYTGSAKIDPETLLVRISPSQGERPWRTLQEVYASLRYDAVRCFTPGSYESGVWAARLAIDAGLLDITLPAVDPGDLNLTQRTMLRGFALLYALNVSYHPDEPAVMFTNEFAAAWCGLPPSTAKRARRALIKRGFLVEVGSVETRRGRLAKLWLLADVADRNGLDSAGKGDDDASGDFGPEDVGWTDEQVQALIDRHGGDLESATAPSHGEQSEAR